jgi:sugar phosphate isomerase/epimerase
MSVPDGSIEKGFSIAGKLPLEASIDHAAESGFDFVEVIMDGDRNRRSLTGHDRLADRLDRTTLGLVLHLPFNVPIGSPYEHVRRGARAEMEACIDAAADLGARKVVAHPESGVGSPMWEPADLRSTLVPAVDGIDAYAAERGVELCIENVFETPFPITVFADLLEATDTAMTLDTGHAVISGYDAEEIAAFVTRYGHRISHLHLNDNRDAGGDEHLPFDFGTVDFDRVLEPLRDDWTGTLCLEVDTSNLRYIDESKEHLDEVI